MWSGRSPRLEWSNQGHSSLSHLTNLANQTVLRLPAVPLSPNLWLTVVVQVAVVDGLPLHALTVFADNGAPVGHMSPTLVIHHLIDALVFPLPLVDLQPGHQPFHIQYTRSRYLIKYVKERLPDKE
jgi:hypothetical protein